MDSLGLPFVTEYLNSTASRIVVVGSKVSEYLDIFQIQSTCVIISRRRTEYFRVLSFRQRPEKTAKTHKNPAMFPNVPFHLPDSLMISH